MLPTCWHFIVSDPVSANPDDDDGRGACYKGHDGGMWRNCSSGEEALRGFCIVKMSWWQPEYHIDKICKLNLSYLILILNMLMQSGFFTSFMMSIQPIVANSDAMWRLRSGSKLAQIMDCCLMAPIHYLSYCWLLIREMDSPLKGSVIWIWTVDFFLWC